MAVTTEVPPSIEKTMFEAMQAHLPARNPKVTPAHVVSGPTLLTICVCARYGGATTLWTTKGGRYRQYICSPKPGKARPPAGGAYFDREDLRLGLEPCEESLPHPEQLAEILASVLTAGRSG
jgi:site-specific DNA recombinase